MATEQSNSTKGNIPVQINLDSVNFDQTLEAFTCGKQQVIIHPLSPGGKPEQVMHVSYIAKVRRDWLPEIDARKNSPVSLGCFINRCCKPTEDHYVPSEEEAYIRLFLDQFFPFGSRWEYIVKDSGEIKQLTCKVTPISQCRTLPEIRETFRGDEPEIFTSVADYEDVENADLVDNVLTKKDREQLVLDPEEDNLLPWQIMDIGEEGESPYRLVAEDLLSVRQSKKEENKTVNLQSDTDLIDWLKEYVDWQIEFSAPVSDELLPLAEVVGFNFNDLRPIVLLKPVPVSDPYDAFIANYEIGHDILLTVIGYDQRPGDYLISLIAIEPNSGLEIIIEADEITFGGRGILVKEIPVGTILRTRLEGLDF